jgi:hypothetical protein
MLAEEITKTALVRRQMNTSLRVHSVRVQPCSRILL